MRLVSAKFMVTMHFRISLWARAPCCAVFVSAPYRGTTLRSSQLRRSRSQSFSISLTLLVSLTISLKGLPVRRASILYNCILRPSSMLVDISSNDDNVAGLPRWIMSFLLMHFTVGSVRETRQRRQRDCLRSSAALGMDDAQMTKNSMVISACAVSPSVDRA